MNHKVVVKLSIEGFCIQTWLAKTVHSYTITENLLLATQYNSVKEAHDAITESELLNTLSVLGLEIIFRDFCHPNP